MENKLEKAVFGGGCFWCTEAVFKMLKGVFSVYPAYGASDRVNIDHLLTYDEVSGGHTGFVEVAVVEFDSNLISFEDLMSVFFVSHDGTQKNRQGNDVGTQYRSVIFYTSENQKKEADNFIKNLNIEKNGEKIITEVEPLVYLYKAEDYHVNYYERNSTAPYCQIVINPKLEKVQKKFINLIKNNN